MSRQLLACGVFAAVTCSLLQAGDSPATAKNDNVIAVESTLIVNQVLPTLDLILEYHVSPPTLQQMALVAARAAYHDARIAVPPQLAARVSKLSTRDEFREFLEGVSSDVLRHSDFEKSSVVSSLTKGALQAARGKPKFIDTKSAVVEEQMKGNRYVGIGIALHAADGGFTQVAGLLDGPGAKAGLKKDDLLVACDGKSLYEKSIEQVIDLLRGPQGSELVLDVRSPGDPATAEKRTLRITRNIVPIKTIQGVVAEGEVPTRHRVDPAAPVAYVRLTRIGASAAQELEQLEPQLVAAGFEALILDLRGVGSDDLHHAVILIDALLDRGLIGKVQTTTGLKEFTADRDCLFRDWPLAVLVDARTKGTAEWVAAALQDRQRATIVGLRTAGDPFVRSFVPVPGSDESLLIATGILERDSEAELARKKRIRSQAVPGDTLPPPDTGSFEEEQPQDAWRVTPDRFLRGFEELYTWPQSLMRARPRAPQPAKREPSATYTPNPQPPLEEPLEKASPARDHFIADALEILQEKLRKRKASSTN